MNNAFTCSSKWDKESSVEETICFLKQLALEHAKAAGPFCQEVTEILETSDWNRLVSYRIDYGRGSADHLYHLRQSLAFFQKLRDLPLGIDPEAVAFDKFVDAESKCRETNARLRALSSGLIQPSPLVAAVIHTAQRKIADVLGDVPPLDELKFRFGPGANTTVKATASSARWKLNAQLECSAELAPSVGSLLSQFPGWATCHSSFPDCYPDHVGEGKNPDKKYLLRAIHRLEEMLDRMSVSVSIGDGRLSFVDKDARCKRAIVVEPILNSVGQSGYGLYIRKMLRKVGVDLEVQAARNKSLAQRASFDGSLATIDLSSASDTISREVVAMLLPLDWYCALRSMRTGRVTYRGQSITLEKFSSMGNAYTFELETLLFWSIAWACCVVQGEDVSEVSSFGDDIILPSGATQALYEVLGFLGFSVNEEKSFDDGRFRESCGGDYVCGLDIRPYYQKDLVSGRTLFLLHNFYVRTLQFEFAAFVLRAIPEELRLWGPDGYGDGHLIGDWSQAARRKKKHIRRGFGGVIFDTFSLKARLNFKPCQLGDRVLPMYSIYIADTPLVDDAVSLALSNIPMLHDRNVIGNGTVVNHYAVRGTRGYRRLSIYTLCAHVFQRTF